MYTQFTDSDLSVSPRFVYQLMPGPPERMPTGSYLEMQKFFQEQAAAKQKTQNELAEERAAYEKQRAEDLMWGVVAMSDSPEREEMPDSAHATVKISGIEYNVRADLVESKDAIERIEIWTDSDVKGQDKLRVTLDENGDISFSSFLAEKLVALTDSLKARGQKDEERKRHWTYYTTKEDLEAVSQTTAKIEQQTADEIFRAIMDKGRMRREQRG